MRGPGIGRGRRCDSLCYQHDLNPTLLELAGAEPAPIADFESLNPALQDDGAVIHEEVFGSMQLVRSRDRRTPHLRMIRRGDHKLIRTAHNGFERWQLFDIAADPAELEDLSQRPSTAALLEDLKQRFVASAERCRRSVGLTG